MLPKAISIEDHGPREGFQIEGGPISTSDKIRLIDALSLTGLRRIEMVSFVSPKLVPGWADADAVASGFTPRPNVRYAAAWFNLQGLQRALAFRERLAVEGSIALSASEAFSKRNLNRDRQGQIDSMSASVAAHLESDVPVNRIIVMAAFGCNFGGDIDVGTVVSTVSDAKSIADRCGSQINTIALADTMGWATPASVERVVSAVRNKWPDHTISLHLHDTHGLGIANAYEAMRLGVTHFDASVGGLGGCPFAGQPNVPGNIATEELVLLCEEMGVETGVDIEALLEAAKLAEEIVGRPLPSAALRAGSLASLRRRIAA